MLNPFVIVSFCLPWGTCRYLKETRLKIQLWDTAGQERYVISQWSVYVLWAMAGDQDSKLSPLNGFKDAVYPSISALVDLGVNSETSKFEDH